MYTGVEVFFEPRSVAVVGASPRPDNMGRAILENLLAGFKGKIFVVNPKYEEVLGVRSYPTFQDVPERVDLAVLAVSAKMTPEIVEDAGRSGVKGVIVFSGGFAETGTEEGRLLQERLVRAAKKYGVRLLGPNCIGVYNYSVGLDTFFLPRTKMRRPPPGPIALVSQSGALLATLMDWASAAHIGIGKAINFGNKADVDEVESLAYLSSSSDVKVIVMYIEGVTRGRDLVNVVKSAVSSGKSVVVIKGGRSKATERATLSHTASVAGSYEVFREALLEAGAILTEDLETAFDIARVLAVEPTPSGRRVGIITNSGGHGVIAADTLTSLSVEVPETPREVVSKLAPQFPERVSLRNPIDLTGDARPSQYEVVAETLLDSGSVDSLMLIALVQPPTMDPDEVVKVVSSIRERHRGTPIVVVTIGAEAGESVRRALEDIGVPTFELPDRAARALAALITRQGPRNDLGPDRRTLGIDDASYQRAREIITAALREGREKLLEHEALELLRLYHIPVADFCLARSEDEASRCAAKIGGSVVMKVVSPDIYHKSDVGGVLVGLRPEEVPAGFRKIVEAVRARAPSARVEGVLVQRQEQGVELIVGGLRDQAFGPVVTFGSGGLLVELIKDVSMRLAPVSHEEAMRMIADTKAGRLLMGYRGFGGTNLAAVADVIVRASVLLADHNEIKELDINPILANQKTAIAVDARVLLSRGGG
ncbi:MAG: acetate--CoA ligase family protein [Acidilobus sp.]